MKLKLNILSLICLFTVSLSLLLSPEPSQAQFTENDNPGADQPDDSALLGDELYPTNLENISLNIDKDSRVAVFDNGYSREAGMFLGLFLPVRMISESEFPLRTPSITLLVIPSGGLTDLKNEDRFSTALNKYVEEGGSLLVFSQRVGRYYSILPAPEGKPVTAYGWLEDQSTLSSSSILSMQHPILSNLASSKPHLNIDGVFDSIPDTSKTALRNSVSGQPVMIIYKYGKGNVIATTLFTDWGYLHQRTTWDEINLFAGIIKWTGMPLSQSAPHENGTENRKPMKSVPMPPLGFSIQSDNEIYLAGDKANFTIRLWNNENRRRKIKVYYDGKGEFVELMPKSSRNLSYSVPVYSTRRLWVYFYDEKEIFLQTIRRGYSVVYPESNNG